MLYKSHFFKLSELLPPEYLGVMSPYHQELLVPCEIKRSLDFIRAMHDYPIVVNTADGAFIYSGLRPVNCPVGAKNSTHKGYQERFAFDLKSKHLDKLLEIIKKHYRIFRIVRIENPNITMPKGYIHIEIELVGNVDGDLVIFTP